MKTKGRSKKPELTALMEALIFMIKLKKKGQRIPLREVEAFRRECRAKYTGVSEAKLEKIVNANYDKMADIINTKTIKEKGGRKNGA